MMNKIAHRCLTSGILLLLMYSNTAHPPAMNDDMINNMLVDSIKPNHFDSTKYLI